MNAEASNQCSSVRWPAGRFPSATRSGSPPEVFVFEGSEPEKLGEKNWPVSMIAIQLACHPPNAKSTGRDALVRNRFPCPNGMAHAALTTARNLEEYWSWLQCRGA